MVKCDGGEKDEDKTWVDTDRTKGGEEKNKERRMK